MPFTHSFSFAPPKRFGSGIGPWTEVRIEESEDDTTFAAVETLALDGDQVDPSGLDADPADPAERSLTTEEPTLESGHFRVVWIDGDGDESPASASVKSPGDVSVYPADEIERRVAHDQEPLLSADDIDYLVEYAKRADTSGRPPSHDNWTATYDLDAAAAEGWRIKAGRIAGSFDFAEDGQRFNLSQLYAHCIRQERVYRRRIVQSVDTTVRATS